MPSIVTTIFDPDAANLLPAKWGKDYQVDAIDHVYLNGQKGFLLDLSLLQDPNINTFVQGCRPIELGANTEYPYYYLLCAASPIPPAIGSAWEEYYRVSECRKVLRKTYTDFESGCREHWHWRLTLATRREPINLLPLAQKKTE